MVFLSSFLPLPSKERDNFTLQPSGAIRMAGPVSVKINLSTGQLEVESPDESLAQVFEHVAAILPALRENSDVEASEHQQPEDAPQLPDSGNAAKEPKKRKPRQRRPTGDPGSGGRRVGTPFYKDFIPFNLGIGDAKEIELAEFFESKKPNGNKNKVLVIIYKLSELINKNLSYDDIYQGLRLAKDSEPPANMSAVVGKLIEDNLISKEENGVRIKVQGSDYVEKSLPKKLGK